MNAMIVGMGGLGCPAALALLRAGIRRLTLVDSDRVDVSNLHRQLLYTDEDARASRLKVEAAAAALTQRFPDAELQTLPLKLDAANGPKLFAAHSLVLDAVDGVTTKFLLSDLAVQTGVALVHAGAIKLEGQVLPILPGGPCLRCLFEDVPAPDSVPTCAGAGVLGSMVGVVGAAQGLLAAQIAFGRYQAPSEGASELVRFDGRTLRSRAVRIRRREDCLHPAEARS